MNRKGQLFMANFMTAIAVIMLVLAFVNPFEDTVTGVQTSLQCSTNSSISDGTKLLCLGLDTTLWYFILATLAGGFGILWASKKGS